LDGRQGATADPDCGLLFLPRGGREGIKLNNFLIF